MPFAKLPDVQIHYELAGPEHLPALIFSHSLGTTLRSWDLQVEPFTKHFRILRYDTRGHGQSGATPGPYTIYQLSSDVLHLLDLLQLDRAYFCGLSMGGVVGLFLGTNAPQRFHKLALCNTAAKIGSAESWNARILAVQNGGMKAVASAVIERWLTPNYRSSHPAETQAALAMLEASNPQGYIACCAAIRDLDQRSTLRSISVPCLALTGTHDPVTPPADAHFLAETIPGATYAEVHAAHLSNVEACNDFNHQVLQFLLAKGARNG